MREILTSDQAYELLSEERDQLRRDRDELVAALRSALDRCKCDDGGPYQCPPCRLAFATLARIKGAG